MNVVVDGLLTVNWQLFIIGLFLVNSSVDAKCNVRMLTGISFILFKHRKVPQTKFPAFLRPAKPHFLWKCSLALCRVRACGKGRSVCVGVVGGGG